MLYSADQREMVASFVEEQYHPALERIATLAETGILPHARRVDEEAAFPEAAIQLLGKEGVMGLPFSTAVGGQGLPFLVYIAALEMVSAACASTAISIAIHNTVINGIDTFGSRRLQKKYLTDLVTGRRLGCFALTEKDTGSDAEAMTARAELEKDVYVLNGEKIYITNAGRADVCFVFAATAQGTSAFLVDRGNPGLDFIKPMGKLGVRGSTLSGIVMRNCRIPKENLVGQEGQGFHYAKEMLNGGRITISALAVGIASMAYRKALTLSRERTRFGKKISQFQLIREKLARMQTLVNSARLLTYYAAHRKDSGLPFASEAAQAKLFAAEAVEKVCNDAIQVYGGLGYVDAGDIHRHWRDGRIVAIGEGTSEIMELVISSIMLKDGVETPSTGSGAEGSAASGEAHHVGRRIQSA